MHKNDSLCNDGIKLQLSFFSENSFSIFHLQAWEENQLRQSWNKLWQKYLSSNACKWGEKKKGGCVRAGNKNWLTKFQLSKSVAI